MFPQRNDEIDTSASEHTAEHPYCSDLTCTCHYSVSYHAQIQQTERNQTAEQVEQAYSFFGIFIR
jgi:hypothetical protein